MGEQATGQTFCHDPYRPYGCSVAMSAFDPLGAIQAALSDSKNRQRDRCIQTTNRGGGARPVVQANVWMCLVPKLDLKG